MVGSINRDIVGYVPRHGRPGETVMGTRSAEFPGGKGSNQAVAIARLGGDVSMIGAVGDDAFGAKMRAFLLGEGVSIDGVRVAPSEATGIALILVDAESENIITVIPGANNHWPDGLDLVAFQPCRDDIVVAQLEIPANIVASAFQTARAAGATTLLNPSPFSPDALTRVLPMTSIVVLNELELAPAAGTSVDVTADASLSRAASRLLEAGVTSVVVTLGANGAAVCDGDRIERVPGIRVAARDTTGAGDCFTGALVAEMLCGVSLRDAAQFAVRAAAISVTRDGAASSFPTRAEL